MMFMKPRPFGALACLAVSVALVLQADASQAQPSFQGLGELTGGDVHSQANAVSSDGSTAVGFSYTGAGTEAFRWTSGGGMVGIGDLPGGAFHSIANGVSADGSTIVGHSSSSSSGGIDSEAFVWTSGGMIGLGDFPSPDTGIFSSRSSDVTDDGSFVAGTGEVFYSEAFSWTSGGGKVQLGYLSPDGYSSFATGVSADGTTIVGGSVLLSVGEREAFSWTSGGGMVGLGELAGGVTRSEAMGVSADGSTVVGQSRSGSGDEAFIWTSGGGIVGLGDLPEGLFRSKAMAASADGSRVVGQGGGPIPAVGDAAFLWEQGYGMRDLNQLLTDLGIELGGWKLRSATGISDDGTVIVGWGTNPSLDTEAWIAEVPAGALALPGLGPVGAALLSSLLGGAGWMCVRRASPASAQSGSL
jgi:probable HAF family extracellular repeat protein